jgi:hypothetical protein
MRARIFFFVCTLTSLISFCRAQTSGPFDTYDCRPEEELIRAREAESLKRELALLDSLLDHEIRMLLAEWNYQMLAEGASEEWKRWTMVGNYAFGKNRGEIPMITALEALHPYFRDKVVELISIARKQGIELAVVETYRTRVKQMEYKSMGRIYTRIGPGASKHQYGLAVDVVPIVNGQAQWHNQALWRKVGVIGERLGLRWGGRWRNPYDPAHFEWTGGLTSEELASGKLPPAPQQYYPCLDDDLRLLKKFWNDLEVSQATLAPQKN